MRAPDSNPPDEPGLHQLLAFSREGLALLDTAGRISWANARLIELCDRGSLIGLTPAQALDDQQELQAPGEGGTDDIDLPIFWQPPRGLKRWGNVRFKRLEPGGNWLFALQDLGAGPSVIEASGSNQSLRTASERAALATQGAGMGTWEMDLANGCVAWDDQMFLLRGLAPAQQPLSNDVALELVHPDDRPAISRAFKAMQAGDQNAGYEFRVRQPDGSYRWLASRSIPVRDESGRILKRIGINWDISDAKLAAVVSQERALALHESQAKSEFLARMSHELRTPLNAVLGFTQLLQTQLKSNPGSVANQQRKLAHIRSAGEHLLALINEVLDLSSIESGGAQLALRPVALQPLVRDTLPLVEGLGRTHEIGMRVGALPGSVRADPIRLRQVLLNLLSNAIKYNRASGQVWLESRAEARDGQPGWCLAVRDSGRGLDAVQLSHLFEPFNRLGRERGPIEGSGIGLAIVKALLQRMQGQIHVHSEPGRGSTFEVWLQEADDVSQELASKPSAPAGAAQQRESSMPDPSSPQPAMASHRLLYIEDNPVNVLVVQELVATRSNLTLDCAVDGSSGVALAARMRPELILVDMQLPDFDGYEVLKRLRAQAQTAQTPCIALSANAMPEDIARALQAGFSDYWTKPIDFKVFLGGLDALFSKPG
ncbi:MAG: response regulator [Burkholderiaceae bacterium]|nr:response regulator [Burkholderiaceae bacterium]